MRLLIKLELTMGVLQRIVHRRSHRSAAMARQLQVIRMAGPTVPKQLVRNPHLELSKVNRTRKVLSRCQKALPIYQMCTMMSNSTTRTAAIAKRKC